MRVIVVTVLLVGAVLAAAPAPTKLSVFVPEDAAASFDPAAILSHSVFIVAKKAPGSAEYRIAAVKTGLAGAEFKGDARYKAIADFLNSPGDKVALFTDFKKFYNKALYDLPLTAGDTIVVPKDYKVEEVLKFQDIPVLFIGEPADFEKLKLEKVKIAGAYEITAGDIKSISI